jgi:hypothetical protein
MGRRTVCELIHRHSWGFRCDQPTKSLEQRFVTGDVALEATEGVRSVTKASTQSGI